MEKQKLDGFINRYSLGGEIESVMLTAKDKELSVNLISDDKTLLGNVQVSDIDFPNGSFGIYTTSQLKGLLTVLDGSIKVDTTSGALKFSDEKTKVQYMLANESVIPKVPELKTLPDFEIEITLDNEFVDKFIKSKGALSDTDTFTFKSDGNDVGEIILGYSTINSNRISLSVNCKCENKIEPIAFSSKYLKSILMANKGSKDSVLKISTAGLSHVKFANDSYKSEYFLVEIK